MTRAEDVGLRAAEAALNRCLRMDPEFLDGLQRFEGKLVCLEVKGLPRRFYARLGRGHVALSVAGSGDGGEAADVEIAGSAVALFELAREGFGADAALPRGIAIAGDVALVQQLSAQLRALLPDWEEELSRHVGDMAAHELARGLRGAWRLGSSATVTLARDVGEYLSEEARLVMTRYEVEDFNAAVDTVRDDVERLNQRVDLLSRRLGPGRS